MTMNNISTSGGLTEHDSSHSWTFLGMQQLTGMWLHTLMNHSMVSHLMGVQLKISNSFKLPQLIKLFEKKWSWKFESLIFFPWKTIVFFLTFVWDFGSKIEISWKFDHQFWLMYSIPCSQFLQMLSRVGWLYGKVI